MGLLLNWLLNHVLFAGTLFFAAGAGMGDPGAGGDPGPMGDPGGDPGAGADPNLSGDPDPDSDPDPQAAGADPNADPNADPDTPIELGNGRTVPAKWKAVLEAAKTAGVDREMRQLFFGQQKLLEKFPGGINEVLQLAQHIEEAGGLDGVAELKSEIETFRQDADLFEKDQAKWVETGFAEDPDASLKAFTHSLDYVSENHPEHYDHLMGKVVLNTLDGSPVHEIYSLLTGLKDNPAAQDLAKKLAGFYNNVKSLAAKVPEKKIDKQQEKLRTQETELNTERQNLRNQTVNSQTIPLLGRQMTIHLVREAKTAGFDLQKYATEQPGAAQSMRREILNRVMAKASSDKTFTRNYRNVLDSGNTKRAIDMMNKKHNDILPEIVRAVAKEWGVAKKAGIKQNARGIGSRTQQAPGNGALRVAGKPPTEDIDYSKTSTRMLLDGQAVLKTGKKVFWQY